MPKFDIEIPNPKDGWNTPIRLGGVKAETPEGAIRKYLNHLEFQAISYHTGYDTDEVAEVYGDGLDIRATPVVEAEAEKTVKYDSQADVWTIVEDT